MIVVDANVVLSAFRSSNGASHILVRKMLGGEVAFSVSPAVALEYEDVLKRPESLGKDPWINHGEVDVVLEPSSVGPDWCRRGFASGLF